MKSPKKAAVLNPASETVLEVYLDFLGKYVKNEYFFMVYHQHPSPDFAVPDQSPTRRVVKNTEIDPWNALINVLSVELAPNQDKVAVQGFEKEGAVDRVAYCKDRTAALLAPPEELEAVSADPVLVDDGAPDYVVAGVLHDEDGLRGVSSVRKLEALEPFEVLDPFEDYIVERYILEVDCQLNSSF